LFKNTSHYIIINFILNHKWFFCRIEDPPQKALLWKKKNLSDFFFVWAVSNVTVHRELVLRKKLKIIETDLKHNRINFISKKKNTRPKLSFLPGFGFLRRTWLLRKTANLRAWFPIWLKVSFGLRFFNHFPMKTQFAFFLQRSAGKGFCLIKRLTYPTIITVNHQFQYILTHTSEKNRFCRRPITIKIWVHRTFEKRMKLTSGRGVKHIRRPSN